MGVRDSGKRPKATGRRGNSFFVLIDCIATGLSGRAELNVPVKLPLQDCLRECQEQIEAMIAAHTPASRAKVADGSCESFAATVPSSTTTSGPALAGEHKALDECAVRQPETPTDVQDIDF